MHRRSPTLPSLVDTHSVVLVRGTYRRVATDPGNRAPAAVEIEMERMATADAEWNVYIDLRPPRPGGTERLHLDGTAEELMAISDVLGAVIRQAQEDGVFPRATPARPPRAAAAPRRRRARA